MNKGAHAVVLGGSLGGLLAARVLSEHFDRVTIVERDKFPSPGENRRGVPQGRHAHLLLASGADALERLFPGFREEAAADGALTADIGEIRFTIGGIEAATFPSGIMSLQVTRPRLEALARGRVLALRNVEAREAYAVEGLETSPDRARVTGVRTQAEGGGPAEQLDADLIVDATGRGSRSPRWLEELGYEPPQEERVGIDLRYMTRFYRRRPEHFGGAPGAIIAISPPETRGAFILAMEEDRWIVTIAAYFGEALPTDDDGWRAFADSLKGPYLTELLAESEPLSEAVPHSYPASQRRWYERLARFPEGYAVFGDALCSFNPVYGQGMSVAALQALELEACLREGGAERLGPRFFKRASPILETPWTIAAGGDLQFDRVEGKRTLMSNVLNWYFDRLLRVSAHDKQVAQAFLEVNNLQAPPTALMKPRIMARVARGRLRRAA